MDGHDLFGVLDAQHHPDHQSEQVRQAHPAEERKAVVLRRGQVAVHVHRGHHAAQTRVRSDRRVAASAQREAKNLHGSDHVVHAAIHNAVRQLEGVRAATR